MSPATTRPKARRKRQPRLPIEVRRQQVLDAALRLIAEDGYRAATMEAIARECDIAKPSVYNAFPGRTPLLKALLEREEQRGLEDLREAMSQLGPEHDPDAAVVASLRTFLEAVRAHPITWRLILLQAEGTPPEVREHVEAGRAFALAQLRGFVRAHLGLHLDDHPSEELDLELAARSVLVLVEQAATLMLTDPDQFPPERYAGFARQMLALLRATG